MIKAAKYLGVAPWELSKQPTFWLHRALSYEAAENAAAANQQAKQREQSGE